LHGWILNKYLGDTVTAQIVLAVGLDKLFAAATTNNVEQTLDAEKVSEQNSVPTAPPTNAVVVPSPGKPVDGPAVVLASLNMTAKSDLPPVVVAVAPASKPPEAETRKIPSPPLGLGPPPWISSSTPT